MEQGNKQFLVSMTNKDVYYVTETDAKTLMVLLSRRDRPSVFETADAKSQAPILLVLDQVSSVVRTGGNRG